MRRLGLILCTLTMAAIAGCGDSEKTGALRVEIVIASADGAVPSGFSMKSDDGERTVALEPAGAPYAPAVLTAKGPAGAWIVVPPAGWFVVGAKGALRLALDERPTPVPVGRAHTIYLVPLPDLPIGDVEVLREGRDLQPVPFERAGGADGRVAVRIAAAEWHDAVRVKAVLRESLISHPARIAFPMDGAPYGVQMRPDEAAGLDVRVFRPADGAPLGGIDVDAEGRVGTLATHASAKTDADGIARFPTLSAVVPEIWVKAAPGRISIPAAEWRLTGEARVLSRPADGADAGPALGVAVPEGGPFTVQVRADGAPSYALDLPVGGAGGAVERPGSVRLVRLPRGHYRLFARAGDRAALGEGRVEDGGGAPVVVDLRWEPLCTLSARVPAPRGEQHLVRVLCRRKEGGEEALAQGWSVTASTPGSVTVSLPVGTYRVCILDGSREGPSVTWKVEKPGSQAQVDLQLP